jgi:hypothetical protein
MIQGRKAFAQYAPPEVVQCFREAGILDSLDEEIITWWDRVSARYREDRQAQNVETGRKGERLSFAYEYKRTGKVPYWIALEYEGAGYDIKSRLSGEVDDPLLIEVKTSNESWGNAKFHLSRKEWKVLVGERHSVLHLWSLANRQMEHAIVPMSDVTPHIPDNQGKGEWESIECPFSVFTPSPN